MNTTVNEIRNLKIDTINDLIAITRDSADFYTEAAGKVENPQLKTLFTGMAESKNGLIGAMSRDIKVEGATPAKDGTFRGTLHKVYGNVRAELGDNKNYSYVSQLEATEDRLLGAFNNVLQDKDVPAPVKEAVTSYLPKVKQQHDLMRDRKWAMQTKH